MGHAMAQMHEQSRADRDTYINMFFNNIQGGQGNFNMEKVQTHDYNPYDQESVLQYSLYVRTFSPYCISFSLSFCNLLFPLKKPTSVRETTNYKGGGLLLRDFVFNQINEYVCQNKVYNTWTENLSFLNVFDFKWCTHLIRSLFLYFNYLVSVTAGGPVSFQGHM